MRAFPQIDNLLIDEKGMYFTDVNYNCFGFLKNELDITNMCVSFSGEERKKPYLFGDLVSVDNYVYAVPLTASYMYKISQENGSAETINITYPEVRGDALGIKAKFMSAHVYDKKIYIMPASYPAIVIFDTQTGELRFIDDWVASVSKVGRENEHAYFRKTKLIGDIIYAPLCKSNSVLKFFIKDNRWELIKINEGNEGYSDICFDGSEFWLSSRMGNKVTRWNEKSGQYKIIDGIWNDNTYFSQIEYYGGKVWVLPREGKNIGIVQGESVSAFTSMQGNKIYSLKLFGDSIYASVDDGCVYEIHSKQVNKHFIKFDPIFMDSKKYFYSDISAYYSGDNSSSLIRENEDNTLELFIEAIKQN